MKHIILSLNKTDQVAMGTKPASAPIPLLEEGRIKDEGQATLNGSVIASACEVGPPQAGLSFVSFTEQGRRQKSIRTSRPHRPVAAGHSAGFKSLAGLIARGLVP
jgi:hypothetical protein